MKQPRKVTDQGKAAAQTKQKRQERLPALRGALIGVIICLYGTMGRTYLPLELVAVPFACGALVVWMSCVAALIRLPFKVVPGRKRVVFATILVGIASAGVTIVEFQTSYTQATIFNGLRLLAGVRVEEGATTAYSVPSPNEADTVKEALRRFSYADERGFTRFARLKDYLLEKNFFVTRQAAQSLLARLLIGQGLEPAHKRVHCDPDEPTCAAGEYANYGFTIFAANDERLYRKQRRTNIFRIYEEIPPLLEALLLAQETRPYWRAVPSYAPVFLPRFFKVLGLRAFGLTEQGGSTIPTQLRKILSSPGHRTTSMDDKIRQMIGAEIDLYREGFSTQETRKDILLDYANHVFLGGEIGYPEVYGFCDGFRRYFNTKIDDVRKDLARNEARSSDLRRKAWVLKQAALLVSIIPLPNKRIKTDKDGETPIIQRSAQRHITYLEHDGQISSQLAEAARKTKVKLNRHSLLDEPPVMRGTAWTSVKDFLREGLALNQEVFNHYFDEMNIEVHTSYDKTLQQALHRTFESHRKRPGNTLQYSVYLARLGPTGSRVIAEYSSDRQFNTKGLLGLGSMAKVRVLVEYLQQVEWLHTHHTQLAALQKALRELYERNNRFGNPNRKSPDELSQTLVGWMANTTNRSLAKVLEDSIRRWYSAQEVTFYTGGRAWAPKNLPPGYKPPMRVEDAFIKSNNLVFVRMLEDIRDIEIAKVLVNDRQGSPLTFDALERQAFEHLHTRWARLGYTAGEKYFVMNLRTALGDSAENAHMLTSFMGVVMTGKQNEPTSITGATLGRHTPYEIDLRLRDLAEDEPLLLSQKIRDIVQQLLVQVVEKGTGQRAKTRGLQIGGKTGTGTNANSRTAAFVFHVEKKIVGSVVVWVDQDIEKYDFTSGLATHLLKQEIIPLLRKEGYV